MKPRGVVSRFGGSEVHWRERAGTAPAVLLMSGCGLAMEFWREVLRSLPESRVIAYDRPGMGGTPWPRRLPTLASEVDLLADLVRGLSASPVVLVAHSMASFHAEAFTREHPELVAGMVLVDGSVEFPTRRPRPAPLLPARMVEQLVTRLRLGNVASAGWRFGSWTQSFHEFRRFGEGRLPAIYRDSDSLAMATAESLAYPVQAWDLLQLRERRPWPGVPTVLLAADEGEAKHHLDRQERLADLLGGRVEVVAHSRHLMMIDQPGVIIGAIAEVVGDADA